MYLFLSIYIKRSHTVFFSGSDDELLLQGYKAGITNKGYRYIILDTFLLGSRTKYTIGQTISGLFTLEFTSTKCATSLEIFGTSFLENDPHPDLPRDSQVTVTQNPDRSLTLSWKRSPSEIQHGQNIEYCVATNQVSNIASQCAALTYARGDRSSLPPHVGFGFSWEKKYKNVSILPEPPPGHINYRCVGRKTTLTLGVLSSGNRYFFDVYAVDRRLNTSSAYTGRSMKVKARRTKLLKDGKMRTTLVSESLPGYYRLHHGDGSRDLLILVDGCQKAIRVDVSRNGRLLNGSTIADNGQVIFRYAKAKKGTYLVTVNAVSGRTTANVWYTTDEYSLPNLWLPENNKLYVDANKTTCHSVTISWAIGFKQQLQQQQQQQCIYIRKIPEGDPYKQLDLSDDKRCAVRRRLPKNERKVRCVQLHAGHVSVHRETIGELRANTAYAVTVYATRHSSYPWLSYQTVLVNTKDNC